MNPGDSVQVRTVWAASGHGREPVRAWFEGYRFVRAEPHRGPPFTGFDGGLTAIVAHVGGVFDGLEVRYPIADVRKEGARDG